MSRDRRHRFEDNEADDLPPAKLKRKSRPMDVGSDAQEVARVIQELEETSDGDAEDFNELYEDEQTAGGQIRIAQAG